MLQVTTKDSEVQKMKKHCFLGMAMGVLLFPNVLQAGTVGIVNADTLNVRNTPDYQGKVIGKVFQGQALEVVAHDSKNNGWYKVNLSTGTPAYVKQEYLTLQNITGTVIEEGLNVRSYPSTKQSTIMGKLSTGTQIQILYRVGLFYKMQWNDMTGFVYADYVDVPLKTYVPTQDIGAVKDLLSVSPTPETTLVDGAMADSLLGNNASQPVQLFPVGTTDLNGKQPIDESLGEAIAGYGMQFLGNPYVYGGNDLLTGVDCSGFTQQVLRAFNIDIPRTSKAQSLVGTTVSLNELQKGDLLFYGTSLDNISHVGIYVGEGQMVHASTPATGIIVSSIQGSSQLPLQVIKRITF